MKKMYKNFSFAPRVQNKPKTILHIDVFNSKSSTPVL